jgi:hypothetical protein
MKIANTNYLFMHCFTLRWYNLFLECIVSFSSVFNLLLVLTIATVTSNLAWSVLTIFWQPILLIKLLEVKTVVPWGRAVQGAAHQGLKLRGVGWKPSGLWSRVTCGAIPLVPRAKRKLCACQRVPELGNMRCTPTGLRARRHAGNFEEGEASAAQRRRWSGKGAEPYRWHHGAQEGFMACVSKKVVGESVATHGFFS